MPDFGNIGLWVSNLILRPLVVNLQSSFEWASITILSTVLATSLMPVDLSKLNSVWVWPMIGSAKMQRNWVLGTVT